MHANCAAAQPRAVFNRVRRGIIRWNPLNRESGVLGVGKQRELIEQSRVGRHLHTFRRGEPSKRFVERSSVDQLLPGRERVRIRLAARIGGPGEIALDVREPRLAVARQITQSVLRAERRLATPVPRGVRPAQAPPALQACVTMRFSKVPAPTTAAAGPRQRHRQEQARAAPGTPRPAAKAKENTRLLR